MSVTNSSSSYSDSETSDISDEDHNYSTNKNTSERLSSILSDSDFEEDGDRNELLLYDVSSYSRSTRKRMFQTKPFQDREKITSSKIEYVQDEFTETFRVLNENDSVL